MHILHWHSDAANSSVPDDVAFVPVFLLHHGAGHSADSFRLMVDLLLGKLQESNLMGFHVVSVDARGHGETSITNQEQISDFSLDSMAADLLGAMVQLRHQVFGDMKQVVLEWILVGHSMGGAVVVETAKLAVDASIQVLGVATIDIVEGTALESLSAMPTLLKARPQSFSSIDDAMEWAVSSQMVHKHDAAQVSIPSLLTLDENSKRYVWKTDLLKTQPFWEGWFRGLSDKFLSVRAAKLLIVAHTDRLDKSLTIGQIQGKFQMVVIPGSGHLMHENAPREVADSLFQFWKRNSKGNLPLALRKKLAITAGK